MDLITWESYKIRSGWANVTYESREGTCLVSSAFSFLALPCLAFLSLSPSPSPSPFLSFTIYYGNSVLQLVPPTFRCLLSSNGNNLGNSLRAHQNISFKMIISLVKLIMNTTITPNLQELQKIYVIVKQKQLLWILHSSVNENGNLKKS